ncbi:MAG: ankyrin repeat domain-containing protein [Nitrospirae bacterium]|nr:ankyrin repeat domain-containing protein [Nitrospirota bacterium]
MVTKKGVNDNTTPPIISSIKLSSVDILTYVLDINPDISLVEPDSGLDALNFAAGFIEHSDIINAILDRGADIDTIGSDGWTPLMRASREGYVSTASILIRHGANINVCDHDGLTAFIIASQAGHSKIMELLNRSRTEPQAKKVMAPQGINSANELPNDPKIRQMGLPSKPHINSDDRKTFLSWAKNINPYTGMQLIEAAGKEHEQVLNAAIIEAIENMDEMAFRDFFEGYRHVKFPYTAVTVESLRTLSNWMENAPTFMEMFKSGSFCFSNNGRYKTEAQIIEAYNARKSLDDIICRSWVAKGNTTAVRFGDLSITGVDLMDTWKDVWNRTLSDSEISKLYNISGNWEMALYEGRIQRVEQMLGTQPIVKTFCNELQAVLERDTTKAKFARQTNKDKVYEVIKKGATTMKEIVTIIGGRSYYVQVNELIKDGRVVKDSSQKKTRYRIAG